MFHKEGFAIIRNTLFIVLLSILLIGKFVSLFWLQQILQIVALVFLILILQFFRNPKRPKKSNEKAVVAPVDGKVVIIKKVYEKEYFKQERLQVSIFMSPVNVHVTRYPLSGTVRYSKYHPGKYLVAWHPKSSENNERTTVVLENETFGKILYRQIAGAVARRIVNYAQKDTQVIQGADSGFIKFGSRLDLFLPLDVNIAVKIGQKVKGAVDVIAQKKVSLYPN